MFNIVGGGQNCQRGGLDHKPICLSSTACYEYQKKTTAADRLNLYTWFPYKLGGCGEVQDVILLDEWVFENNGRFSENAQL